MIPASRLIVLAAIWAAISFALAGVGLRADWIAILGVTVLLGVVLDAAMGWRWPDFSIEREVSPVLSVHQPATVTMRISQAAGRDLTVWLYDQFDGHSRDQGLPASISLPGNGKATFSYQLTPTRRGPFAFTAVRLRVVSPFGLWLRQRTIAMTESVRVLPDFSTLAFNNLAPDSALRRLEGLRRLRRGGGGTEFHQLRDYEDGDPPARVDWKATARHGRLTVREFQVEKGQPLLIAVDQSRRLRAEDNGVSHFDAALMSAVRLTQAAREQGDAVGCITFSGPERWLPPKTGTDVATNVLNSLYDLHPGLGPPDYLELAQRILVRQRRRSLVVIVTNLRDEDSADLVSAARLLSRRHLVMIASLRESQLDEHVAKPIESAEDAQLYLSIDHFLRLRDKAHARVKSEFPHLVDATAKNLASAMITHYRSIKASGQL